ncbi:MAG: RNA polymerase sigma factor [Candidatus Pacebacteria bacterium]|nr:RNA polymerase sigma factor [Candidatus Paceibacterota bacterium]
MDSPYEDLSDKELVATVLLNKDAFSVIITRYEAPLRRYINRLGVRDPRDMEDLLQNSFIKVYRYLQSFDNSFSFSSWIYRIVHNETYDFFRSKKRRPEITLDDDSQQTFLNIESEHEGPEQIFDKDVDKQLLAKALDSLDKKYKDVLLLRYGEDKDYQQISDILQIPNGTVATLIHRGKKELKKVLTKEK